MDNGKCATGRARNPKAGLKLFLAMCLASALLVACAARDVEFRAKGEMRTSVGVGQGVTR